VIFPDQQVSLGSTFCFFREIPQQNEKSVIDFPKNHRKLRPTPQIERAKQYQQRNTKSFEQSQILVGA
jgi:hypothetical protein